MATVTGQPALSVTPFFLPDVVGRGNTASYSVTIAGGVAPYSVRIIGGALPPGLTLTGTTIAGNFAVEGAYSFTLSITDLAGNIITLFYSGIVLPADQPPVGFVILTAADGAILKAADGAILVGAL